VHSLSRWFTLVPIHLCCQHQSRLSLECNGYRAQSVSGLICLHVQLQLMHHRRAIIGRCTARKSTGLPGDSMRGPTVLVLPSYVQMSSAVMVWARCCCRSTSIIGLSEESCSFVLFSRTSTAIQRQQRLRTLQSSHLRSLLNRYAHRLPECSQAEWLAILYGL
jgi:hypothetical protein